MKDLSDLVPNEYDVSHIPTLHEHSFCYIGYESLSFLADYWENKAAEYSKKGETDNADERIIDVSEAELCRKRADNLKKLMPYAESKPLIFGQKPYEAGQRITCFFESSSKGAPDGLNGPDRFVDATVIKVVQHGSKTSYQIRLRSQASDNLKLHTFTPDKVSAIPTDDFLYLRVHPNFFRMYLNIRATTECERSKIIPILSAL
ncbi:hypothetical protein IK146_01880 [Candidatus Saccharibacteria bacterium]|nr:hypothetical protein [Candidatus Saccharibacteria bacterium]